MAITPITEEKTKRKPCGTQKKIYFWRHKNDAFTLSLEGRKQAKGSTLMKAF